MPWRGTTLLPRQRQAHALAFNKFDPYSEASSRSALEASSEGAERRAKLLKYGWWISVVQVAMGFGFIGYWMISG